MSEFNIEFSFLPELEQHIDDILRFHRHSDPQLGASVGTVVGQYIRASLIHGCGQYNDLGRPGLALPSLLEILCKVGIFAGYLRLSIYNLNI